MILRLLMCILLGLAVFSTEGCTRRNPHHQTTEQTKPRSKIHDALVPDAVDKAIASQNSVFLWLEVVSIVGLSLSVGAGFFLRTLLPGMGWIATAAAATFGTMFALSVTTQIALPYIPYFIVAALVAVFIAFVILLKRNLNWKWGEAKGVVDIHKRIKSPEAKAVLAEVKKKFPKLIDQVKTKVKKHVADL